jgi:hypothetical protein
MFCTQCAAALPAGVLFCTGCGSAVNAAAPAPRPNVDGPAPPDMHWGLVLGLSIITLGLFWFFWSYKVAVFVRKVDPASKAVTQALAMAAVFAVQIAIFLLLIVVAMWGNADLSEHAEATWKVFNAVIGLINIFMIFGMKKSLVWYYNLKEPIGLKLNDLMVLVFGVVYLQFNLSNIAAWKKSQPRTA